jgi:hypothetical protein
MSPSPETEMDRLRRAQRIAQLKEAHPELFADHCPESADGSHGPADGQGKCPWCGRKYTSKAPAPPSYPPTNSDEAYEYHYNDDEHRDRRY